MAEKPSIWMLVPLLKAKAEMFSFFKVTFTLMFDSVETLRIFHSLDGLHLVHTFLLFIILSSEKSCEEVMCAARGEGMQMTCFSLVCLWTNSGLVEEEEKPDSQWKVHQCQQSSDRRIFQKQILENSSDSYNLDGQKCTFCSMLSSKRLSTCEGQALPPPCHQLFQAGCLTHNWTFTFSWENTAY